MKRALIFFLLCLSACGPEEETECNPTVMHDGDAQGSLVVVPAHGTPISPTHVSMNESDRLELELNFLTVELELPKAPGTYELADLGAQLCFFRWDDCVPLTGTFEVQSGGRQSFAGTLRVDGQEEVRDGFVVEGEARVTYSEHVEDQCHTSYHGGGNGCLARPGSGSMLN